MIDEEWGVVQGKPPVRFIHNLSRPQEDGFEVWVSSQDEGQTAELIALAPRMARFILGCDADENADGAMVMTGNWKELYALQDELEKLR